MKKSANDGKDEPSNNQSWSCSRQSGVPGMQQMVNYNEEKGNERYVKVK